MAGLARHQALVCLAAAVAGVGLGVVWPGVAQVPNGLLWLLLGALLFCNFVEVRFHQAVLALGDGRFMAAALTGNFVLLPLLAWWLSGWVGGDPAVRLGVLLVLLLPCTDWFMAFAAAGGGDTRRAVALAPVNLVLQLLLLPVYLGWMLPGGVVSGLASGPVVMGFGLLVGLPLLLAAAARGWARRSVGGAEGQWLVASCGRLTVPLLAAVVLLVAATQAGVVLASPGVLASVGWVFACFLLVAALLAKGLAAAWRLPPEAGRVLAFSFGTRNSFVALPLALALPEAFAVTVVIVVFQSLVELLGMALFLWLVPRRLFARRREVAVEVP